MGILGLIVILVGGAIGGQNGLATAFIFALAINGGAYFLSDRIALAAAGAKPLTQREAPDIYKMVENLTAKSGIPMPKLFITPDSQANAFATGRNPDHASLALTQGLLNTLSLSEIRGVLSHELSHIKNRDILITSVAAVIASSVSFLANMGFYGGFGGNNNRRNSGGFGFLAILLAPIAAMLLQLAVSREREYEADRSGALMLGTSEPLAQALTDIGRSTAVNPTQLNPALATLYIANPMGGHRGTLVNLFSTHPPLPERINRLRSMRF